MEGYLGEFPVDVSTHPVYSSYTETDWAMLYIHRYGGIEGDHHKAWVLDQVAQILKGTPVDVVEARWSNGHAEHRFHLGEPSPEYLAWVEEQKGETYADGSREYDYDIGIAP